MISIFFLFSKQDYINYKNKIKKNDILISVSFIDNIDTSINKYICLDSYDDNENDLKEFTIFFKKYFQFDKDSWAFANNFYELCYEYYSKLNFIINTYNIKNIFFPKKIIQYSFFGFQKYIGAEYETQKVFLYRRDSAFLYLVKSILKDSKVKIKYSNRRRYSFYMPLNLLRLIILFAFESYRVLSSKNKIFFKSSENKSKYLYLFRTSKTLNFASFRDIESSNDFIYNNSITNNYSKNKFDSYKKISINALDIINVYAKVFKNLFIILFKKRNHKINFTQAFLEIQIMSLQTRIYYLTLNRLIKDNSHAETLFNFEVKSPYAYYDKKIADNNNKKLVTLLSFDLLEKKMPEIFYSNFLHVSNDDIKNQLDKVRGINKSIISISNLHRFNQKSFKSLVQYNYCLFLGTFLENNMERLNLLWDLKVSFCVRKHPRDNFIYEDKFTDLFISRKIQDVELFNLFNYGITGVSGIVDVLISNSKPFYLLEGDFAKDLSLTPYYKNGYYGNIINNENLKTKLNDSILVESFKNHFPMAPELNLSDFYNKIDSI